MHGKAVEAMLAVALAALIAVVRRTPRWGVPVLAGMVTMLARPLARRDRRRLRENIHRIYGLPPWSPFSRMFERQCARHQVCCALETLQALDDPARLQISGFEALQARVRAAEARGKPHVFVTAHLGAWELCAFYAARASARTLRVLAKPSRYAAVTKALNALREERMRTPVLWTGSKTLLRDMLGTLKRGENLGFVMDQKPEGRQGPIVPFFGVPTAFVSGPAAMALRADAVVLAVFVVREGAFRYRILSETLWGGSEADLPDETGLTATMAAAIEGAVRAYPEQWTWSYKRWRWPSA